LGGVLTVRYDHGCLAGSPEWDGKKKGGKIYSARVWRGGEGEGVVGVRGGGGGGEKWKKSEG